MLSIGAAGLTRSSPMQKRGMATLKEVQMRLKSVKNIAKITKSMKMIASTKLSRAQRSMEAARLYGQTSASGLRHLEIKSGPTASEGTPLKTLLIPASSDRGLCGAIHSQISKAVKKELRLNEAKSSLFVIGDKARMQITREFKNSTVLSVNGVGKNIPTFAEAAGLCDALIASGIKYGDAKIYYNRFNSVVSYECTVLPVYSPDAITGSDKLSVFEMESDENMGALQNYSQFTFASQLYHALVEGNASEMAARRTAMENATKNAGEMIDKLTMTYNRRRQAVITSELCDIITGASAL